MNGRTCGLKEPQPRFGHPGDPLGMVPRKSTPGGRRLALACFPRSKRISRVKRWIVMPQCCL